MRISIFGTGYVGLVQGATLAEVGNQVVCVDLDKHKVARLNQGDVPLYEPGLEPLVNDLKAQNLIDFTTDTQHAIAHASLYFVAVGTPQGPEGDADLSAVRAVCESIAQHVKHDFTLVLKSTVPLGTNAWVTQFLTHALAGKRIQFSVISNPEFLKEGAALADCRKPDRIILGGEPGPATALLEKVYAPFNRNHQRVIVMSPESAELTKYASNCMLATKISFMNELSRLAEKVGADIEAVRQGMGADPRIGYHFIYPGCGYGGSCFPKDVNALIASGSQYDENLPIMRAVHATNDRQKAWLFEKVKACFNSELKGKRIAVWGLAFKPNTDDLREAPSLTLINGLLEEGASVQGFDPEAMEQAQAYFDFHPALTLFGTKEAALKGADALVICTEWQIFRTLSLETLRSQMRSANIIDGRNMYDLSLFEGTEFYYNSIGRPSVGSPDMQIARD